MSTMAAQAQNKPRMGRVPIVPWVRCARRRCHAILGQRHEPWQGDPLWIICRKCGAMNRISVDGVWEVEQAGELQPVPR